MKHITILVFFFSIILTNAQTYIPEFESDECPYFMELMAEDSGVRLVCGYLYVPENRDDVDGSLELELFVARIESLTETDNAPIVYLEGGPGGAASVAVGDWLDSGLVSSYDMIFIDQRGTGLSYPSLNCYEYDESDDDDWLSDCRERLVEDENVDLDMYNSVTNAHDIHDLLIALDIEEANLYGSSYGTRLALTMMRDFPERTRAVIIDAVYPPHVDGLVEQVYFGNQAFEQLFNDCAIDAECNLAYPSLRDSFYTAIDNMNDEPAEIEDYELGFVVEMNGDDFANQIFSMLYDSTSLAYLPAMISAYAEGEYDYDPFVEAETIALEESISDGNIVADEYDIVAMELLDFTDVDDLYNYYGSLDDVEYDDLMLEIEDHLYYAPFVDYLELDSIDDAIDYLDNVDDEEYFELEAWVLGLYDDDSEGMYYSVECAEEIAFYAEDDVIARSGDVPEVINDALLESVLFGFEDCAIWDVAVGDAIEVEPVVSDIPTLVFSGAYDPVTPQDWGQDTTNYLENSQHYVFANIGHGALDVVGCSYDMAQTFLLSPMQTVDSSCLGTITAPNFYIRPKS